MITQETNPVIISLYFTLEPYSDIFFDFHSRFSILEIVSQCIQPAQVENFKTA